MSLNDAVLEILSYIGGDDPRNWYVGIAQYPRDRLFGGHGVREQLDSWIYVPTPSTEIAREIERYFINEKQTKGGDGGGNGFTKSVYAYRTASHTRE